MAGSISRSEEKRILQKPLAEGFGVLRNVSGITRREETSNIATIDGRFHSLNEATLIFFILDFITVAQLSTLLSFHSSELSAKS